MKEEKTGSIAELRYHNEESFYTIATIDACGERFCAVGYMPMPKKGRRYRFTGEWTVHRKYGEQFAFSSYEELEPTTEEGIAAFLASGVIRGVGPATASAIVKEFGESALKVIQEDPGRLTKVSGIGKIKAMAIAASYAEHREYADTVLQLSAFGIGTNICMKLYKQYGAEAVETVRQNPYRLIDDMYGVGFRTADKIAQKIGFKEDSPFRIRSGIKYAINQQANAGDTYVPRKRFVEDCAGLLDVSREQTDDACMELVLEGDLFLENIEDVETLMLWRYHRAETRAAAKLYALCHSTLTAIAAGEERLIDRTERETGIELSEGQRHAVISSLKNGVSVITGGPGTGKTTIIKAILGILKNAGISTALAAPTGRAAKRMSQATGCEASTIHRLLEYQYTPDESSMFFGRNEENPLEYGCIIIDEMSMVDILLMEGLLAAVKPGSRLILVGDADQLPPVGAGNVLRDILSSDTVHSVRLTEIFRQAAESMIVVNAHQINKGEYPSYNGKDRDFFLLERHGSEEIASTIKELVSTRLPAYYNTAGRPESIQVLTRTRKNRLGCVELNKELQAVLNPSSPERSEKTYGSVIFREGDKVMQNKNDYMLGWKNLNDFSSGLGVFNGDIGIVRSVNNDAGTVSVVYDDEKMVTYDNSNLDELETAFALTVHKSQGSEFPVVVMPVTSFPPVLSTRNLLYTAVTRARQAVVLVGDPAAVNAMIDNNSVTKRYSGLAWRLRRLWDLDV